MSAPGGEAVVGRVRARLYEGLRERLEVAVSQVSAAAALIALFIALSFASPHFLTEENLFNVGAQTAVTAIVAMAETLIIITAGIDLSVGSVAALSGVIAALAISRLGVGVGQATLVGIVVGIGAGLLDGFLVTKARISPFIATLGMMTVARGLVFISTGGVAVYGLPTAFQLLGNGEISGFPIAILVLLLVAVITAFVLSQSTMGRYMYAIGSNPEAARRSGIPVDRYLMGVYAFAGALVGIGGLVAASRVNSGQPGFGEDLPLDVIAAAVIGGASLFGGQGRIVGTLIGAFLIALVRNGSVLLGINIFYQEVIIGVIIWLAVYFDRLRRRRLSERE
ncbi:MAG: ABC transporter permease [Streptosporangiaceae bacterium]